VRHSTYPPGSILLLAGTRRGLFLLSSRDRQHWQIEATKLETLPSRIYYAVFDPRNNYRLFVADNGDFFGSFLRYSDDFGQTWHEPEQGIQFPPASGEKLKDIWFIEPGRPSEPETLYAGTDPACLWVSHDRGETWEANTSLLYHSTHDQWESGSGGTCLHSIIADPTNSQRMWVSISGAGNLRTDDGGANWHPVNALESKDNGRAEVGNGSHRLLQHSTQPDTLYLQGREGVFQSLDAGERWQDIRHNLPSPFGFPLALDTHHPETLFNVVVDPHHRFNLGQRFTVFRSQNGGVSWEALTQGLPAGPAVRLKVLRHALCTDTLDPCGVYVGTTSGQIFASNDRGDHWSLIANYLPQIFSVTATVVV
jgi:photosystem II stability/assembly factor-like uncharacterized protein